MAAIVCQSGCDAGSQRTIWGSSSIGATTPTTGWSLESWMIWSGFIIPKVIEGSWYISAAAVWLPTAGPPARIWRLMPVLLPRTVRGPVTRLWAALAAAGAWPVSPPEALEHAPASSARANAAARSRPRPCWVGEMVGTDTVGSPSDSWLRGTPSRKGRGAHCFGASAGTSSHGGWWHVLLGLQPSSGPCDRSRCPSGRSIAAGDGIGTAGIRASRSEKLGEQPLVGADHAAVVVSAGRMRADPPWVQPLRPADRPGQQDRVADHQPGHAVVDQLGADRPNRGDDRGAVGHRLHHLQAVSDLWV